MSSASPTSPRELSASEVKVHPLFAGQKNDQVCDEPASGNFSRYLSSVIG
jgi:hypothetical protein